MEQLRKGSTGSAVKELQSILHVYADGIFGAVTEEAVKAFQKSNGLVDDGIVGDKTWAILKGTQQMEVQLKKSSRKINEIIVHCTATPEGKDYTVAQIRQMHTAPVSKGGRGWSDIGYHYVVYRNGEIHEGRNVNIGGAHCTGHNTNSIGVVYVGGVAADGKTPKDTRTGEQKTALVKLVKSLMLQYNLTKYQVHGHYEYANKACPSFKIDLLRSEL